MKASFRPEFVNRVDEFVVFEALKLNEIREIVKLQAKRVEQRLKDKKMQLDLTESAIEYLAVRATLIYQVPFRDRGRRSIPALSSCL